MAWLTLTDRTNAAIVVAAAAAAKPPKPPRTPIRALFAPRIIGVLRQGHDLSTFRAAVLLTLALAVLVDLTVAMGVGVALASLMFVARMNQAEAVPGGAGEPVGEDPGAGRQH